MKRKIQPWKHLVQAQKRLDAEKRQAERDNRTDEEQMALILERPGYSEKETNRILKNHGMRVTVRRN